MLRPVELMTTLVTVVVHWVLLAEARRKVVTGTTSCGWPTTTHLRALPTPVVRNR